MRRAGLGTSSASAPRATPTTSWISWSGKLRRLPAATRGRPAAARLPRQQRADRHPGPRPGGTRGGDARGALGGGPGRARVARRRGLQVSPRPRPGGGLCADPGRRAGGGAPRDRPAARRAHPAGERSRRTSSRSSVNSTAGPRLITLAQGARAARRAEPDRGQARQGLDRLCLGAELSHRRRAPCCRRTRGSGAMSSLSRSRSTGPNASS